MKHILTAAILLATIASAQAAPDQWTGNFRRCELNKQFTSDDGGVIFHSDSIVSVAITPDDIPAIERGLILLRQCNKFWECVNKRDAGKIKHCYLPRSLRP